MEFLRKNQFMLVLLALGIGGYLLYKDYSKSKTTASAGFNGDKNPLVG